MKKEIEKLSKENLENVSAGKYSGGKNWWVINCNNCGWQIIDWPEEYRGVPKIGTKMDCRACWNGTATFEDYHWEGF